MDESIVSNVKEKHHNQRCFRKEVNSFPQRDLTNGPMSLNGNLNQNTSGSVIEPLDGISSRKPVV